MSLTVYHLKTCDTCRKAIKMLTQAGLSPQLIDVRADGVSKTQLRDWIERVGYEALLNTRSTTWRGLDDADKADMSADKAATLMDKHPTLIKRPVITEGKTLTIGWKADAQNVWIN